jgi:hypothetical protein
MDQPRQLDDRTERELQVLEAKAGESTDSARAAPCFNAAGDICRDAGDLQRAMRYYGQAIDSYLSAGLFVAARVVSKKLIQLAPHAVRARCTLAWLSLGRGLASTAKRELAEYVGAARAARQQDLAIRHLRMMGEVVWSQDLRRFIGAQLAELGDDLGSRAVLKLAETPEKVSGVGDDRWERVLQAALMAPDDLLGRPSLPPSPQP